MPPDPPKASEKKTIRMGSYEVVSHIATGGMGAVYRAVDTNTNQDVALKVLTKASAAKPALLERFRREARNSAKLRHENIVHVYEFGEHKGTHYIAMEFVDGVDMHDFIDDNGPLDPEESRQVMLQATRALACAHEAGIVHRDIKPSNFLVTKKGSRIQIKMTDLGLAREVISDEYRVTRAGTTVGTVDYISPEQARDSGDADVRSDMYSLGCTWFHMLSGRPPFDKGGLAERLLKHMESPPPDIREDNPEVSDELAKVMRKLMAKKPEDRYQNPQELLMALNEMRAVREGPPPKSRAKSRKPTAGKKPAKAGTTPIKKRRTESGPIPSRRKKNPYVLWGILGAVLTLSAVVGLVLVFLSPNKEPEVTQGTTTPTDSTSPKDTKIRPVGKDKKKEIDKTPITDPPVKPKYAKLYEPSEQFDFENLHEKIVAPWKATPTIPEDAPVLHVSRLSQEGEKNHTTLESALGAVKPNEPTIVEIRDNGPIYVDSVRTKGKQVSLRAGKGYRPLLVWDVPPSSEPSKSVWLDLDNCSFTMRGIEWAFHWPSKAPALPINSIFRLTDSELTLEECSFSVAGRNESGILLAKMDRQNRTPRFRATNCFIRGESLRGFSVPNPGVEILFQESLLAVGGTPLFDLVCDTETPNTIHLEKTTLVAGEQLIHLTTSDPSQSNPRLEWISWDSLIARSSTMSGGKLLLLTPGLETQAIQWKSVNTLYTGWSRLLESTGHLIQWTQMDHWRKIWEQDEGDKAQGDLWPKPIVSELATEPASSYRVEDTPVAYASSVAEKEPMGCPLPNLPSTRDQWISFTVKRYKSRPVDPLFDTGPPEIPPSTDGKYHGERIDLNREGSSDLGVHLRKVQSTKEFASHVVLHLQGSGEKVCSPIRIKAGTSVTIYFEQPDRNEERLSLRFEGSSTPSPMLHLEKGNLDILNGDLRLGEAALGRKVNHLIELDGTCRTVRTFLDARQAPKGFEALLSLRGTGETDPEKTQGAVLIDSVLLSKGNGIQGQGLGLRASVDRCLVVAEEDILALDLGPRFQGNANTFCTFDHCTLALGKGLVYTEKSAHEGPPTHPVVIQTLFCAWFDPFPADSAQSSVFRFDAADILRRGQIVWQSEGDAFDARLKYALAPSSSPQPQKNWKRLWGSASFEEPILDLPVKVTFPEKDWPLHELTLPRLSVPQDRKPGADLNYLGVMDGK